MVNVKRCRPGTIQSLSIERLKLADERPAPYKNFGLRICSNGVRITVERGVNASLGDQICAIPVLHDAPVFHNNNPVQPMNRREAVGDDEGSAATHEFHDRFHDGVFRAGIESAGGLIQQKNRGVFEESAGDANPLALSHAQVAATLSDRAIESLGHFIDEIQRLCLAGCLDNFLFGRTGFAIGDIFADGG